MTHPILVTGATGHVGSSVLETLTGAGLPVRAAAGSAAGLRVLSDPATRAPGSVETVLLDFTDPNSWPAAYDGVEQLFLMRPPT